MRSTLIRVEQANRLMLVVATGLGAIVLGTTLLRAEDLPSQSHPVPSGSASTAAPGSATTPAASAAPPAPVTPTENVDLDALARAALKSAAQSEDGRDYAGCLRSLAPGPDTWSSSSQLSDELSDAVWFRQRSCIRRARAEADKEVRAKDYPAAIELLEPLVKHVGEGSFHSVDVEGAWLLSDLAFAYQRNHQYVECIQLVGGMSLLGDDTEKVSKAIDHNLDGCNKRLDAEYAIKSGGCRISIDGAIATAAVPPALAPKGAAAACVALVPGAPTPDTTQDERGPICPVVALVWKGARGAIERKELRSAGHDPSQEFYLDPLTDEDYCLGSSSIAFGTRAGKDFVRVSGAPGENCQGRQCYHISSVDMFYEWNGEVLTQSLDVTY
jgi:hypothetical protein